MIFEGQRLEAYDIKCVQRQVQMGDAGIVDILGWDRRNKTWVIVEIKRDGLDSKAYAQAMRYRSWLNHYLDVRSCERRKPYREPYVLLIGSSMSDDLRFVGDITDNEDRSAVQSYYLLYNVKPSLWLGQFTMKRADNYKQALFADIDRRLM